MILTSQKHRLWCSSFILLSAVKISTTVHLLYIRYNRLKYIRIEGLSMRLCIRTYALGSLTVCRLRSVFNTAYLTEFSRYGMSVHS